MSMRTIGKIVFLTVLTVPVAVAARQTFKQQELPKADFNTEVAPRLEITTESGQTLPARVRFESKQRGVDARAQVAKVTYTKIGLTVELSGGSYSSRSGNWATEAQPFQKLVLEFANGDLISEKAWR